MVSTRSVRFKFSEGERVLCYEPDPTKAKVLYDSKVLEVIDSKDKRGRHTVEYLIHFQGWNSSWDRCVSEDFVLKDTEENRQLQRDLAEKSQLQLGAYLYRRERKKVPSNSAVPCPDPAKRQRHGFSDDGSSTSTQPDEPETVDTDSSSESDSSSQASSPPDDNDQSRKAHIVLPSSLRDRLTFDYHMVVKRGRLIRLPATPCAAYILESFMKWFARAGAWHPARGRNDPPVKPDLLDVLCRLNLIREVADGLRVYFDFILGGHLLYNKQERNQYNEICGNFNKKEDVEIKSDLDDEESQSQDETDSASVRDDLMSPKMPEYSHLPPDPVDDENSEESMTDPEEPELDIKTEPEEAEPDIKTEPEEEELDIKTEPEEADLEIKSEPEEPELEIKTEPEEFEMESDDMDILKNHWAPEDYSNHNEDDTNYNKNNTNHTKDDTNHNEDDTHDNEDSTNQNEDKIDQNVDNTYHTEDSERSQEELPTMENINVARRLRSHKSAISHSENDEPTPSTSAEQPTFETLSSSVESSSSSISDGCSRPVNTAAPTTTRTPLSLLLEKVSKWQIIPRDGTEHLPCRVYGATHLARLFVRLPDFLNATQMPDLKLKLILKYIDLFVQYLNEHGEWFGEMYYT